MQREAEENLPQARVGLPSKYRQEAKFVLKLMPDMDRNKAAFDQRVRDQLAETRQKRRLDRQDFEPGAAGYLYGQARAFLSALESLPSETDAIALSDFDFGEPQTVCAEKSPDNSAVRVSGELSVRHRQPAARELMARMGTTMVAAMAAAFACEVGMKAILITRLDGAKKTHDLLELYEALPSDSRKRLEADLPRMAGVLADSRHAFGKWRYFEQNVGADAMLALVNTRRVRDLGKAARVIVDECVIAGLQCEFQVRQEDRVVVDQGQWNHSQSIRLEVTSDEAAIPWEKVLPTGQDAKDA